MEKEESLSTKVPRISDTQTQGKGMMGEEGKSMYMSAEVVEEILVGLPLKSIMRFKSVSKQWRSILESERFAERRRKVPKKRKILAAHNCNCGDPPSLLLSESKKLEGDEEIVFLHCDVTKPFMSCDGVVCFPGPDWTDVVNPSTGQFRRFLSELGNDGDWVFGFGKDRVTGSFKVVKMCEEKRQSYVLDVESGEWKKLCLLPPCVHGLGRESVCVDGSIYWPADYRILALDLHTQEFHYVSVPASLVMLDTQVVNLQDRLAVSNNTKVGDCWILEIYTLNNDAQWSLTYSIDLPALELDMCIPVAVSKQGNLVFCNTSNNLYKYYPRTCELQCLSSDICVLSSYLENLVPLGSGHHPSPIRRTCTNRSLSFKFGIRELVAILLLLFLAACLVVLLHGAFTWTYKCWKEEPHSKWWKEEPSSNERLGLMFFSCFSSFLVYKMHYLFL